MFPGVEVKNYNEISNTTSIKQGQGKTFDFNFETGEFNLVDGKLKVIEGKEALIGWIDKILRTEKDKYVIYDSGYGIKLLDCLNSDLPTAFLYAEIQKNISAALMVHSDILNITGFKFERINHKLNIEFTIKTKYGDVGEEVRI